MIFKEHADGSCNWVPAVFLKDPDNGRRIYGGVNLQPKLREGYVPPNHAVNTYNGNNLLNQGRQFMQQSFMNNSNRNGPYHFCRV